MLQRIQTIYLTGVVLCCIVMLFFPFAEFSGYSASYRFSASGIEQLIGEAHPLNVNALLAGIPFAGIIISLLAALIAVFSFKKRLRQIQVGKLNLLLLTALLATVFLVTDEVRNAMDNPNDVAVNYGISSVLPVISIILTWLANRAIRKDEEKVRAADRIR